MLIRRLARPLLATAFVARGASTLQDPKVAADAMLPLLERSREILPESYAQRVPNDALQLARTSAAVQVGGGVLLALGRAPRLASAALAGTLVTSNLGAHPFWREQDPERKATERALFLSDLGLLGGLMIAAVDTEGKPSLGWRGRRAASTAAAAVASALPFGASSGGGIAESPAAEKVEHGLSVAAERGRNLAEAAKSRGADLAEAVSERGPEIADAARERGTHLAELARERGPEVADAARDRLDSARHRLS